MTKHTTAFAELDDDELEGVSGGLSWRDRFPPGGDLGFAEGPNLGMIPNLGAQTQGLDFNQLLGSFGSFLGNGPSGTPNLGNLGSLLNLGAAPNSAGVPQGLPQGSPQGIPQGAFFDGGFDLGPGGDFFF